MDAHALNKGRIITDILEEYGCEYICTRRPRSLRIAVTVDLFEHMITKLINAEGVSDVDFQLNTHEEDVDTIVDALCLNTNSAYILLSKTVRVYVMKNADPVITITVYPIERFLDDHSQDGYLVCMHTGDWTQ